MPANAFQMAAGGGGREVGLDDRLWRSFCSTALESRASAAAGSGDAPALPEPQRPMTVGIVPKPRNRRLRHGALGRLIDGPLKAVADAIASRPVGLGHDVCLDRPKVVRTALVDDRRTTHSRHFGQPRQDESGMISP